MRIKLLPARCDDELTVFRYGDKLYLNGEEFDFTLLPDGATLPSEAINSHWIIGPVERVAGEIVLSILLPHAADASESARFPTDILNPPAGYVSLPI